MLYKYGLKNNIINKVTENNPKRKLTLGVTPKGGNHNPLNWSFIVVVTIYDGKLVGICRSIK